MLDSYEGETLYTYDALGQLTSETKNSCPECSECGTTVNITYDNYGNILTKGNHTYGYDNVLWKDRLTSFDGQSITYDAQGNPVNYLGHNLTWEKGRQLKSFDNIQYTYNANGIRISKTVDNVRHDYVVDGAKILKETWQDNVLVPIYNNEQEVVGIYYNCTPYYFYKNLQGDVIGISDNDGRAVVTYSYDAWGVCAVLFDNSGIGLADINPYRYRSYYYDTEIGMYYLQSRYYDPVVGRFINSDASEMLQLVNITNTIIDSNLFSYCFNNPITDMDVGGFISADKLACMFSISAIFGMFMQELLINYSRGLVLVSGYATKISAPIAIKAFWWKPVLAAILIAAAVLIVVTAVTVLYNTYAKTVAKADAKIKTTVKNNSKTRYWTATVKIGYVDIGRAITYSQAVKEVIAGRSVFTVTWYEAKEVALAAGGSTGKNNKILYPEIDKGKENTKGYYWHYHTYNRKGGHVYYLF